jgi:hypothetical protein
MADGVERDHCREEAAAIKAAWSLFLRRGGDVSFMEIMSCARAQYPAVTSEHVWIAFEARLRREWWRAPRRRS